MELRYIDKTTWGDGPWQDEPDKVTWIDPATGLSCMIRRSPGITGALCGYVGVPEGHPLYGASYQEPDLDVHGGLTYSDKCDGDEQHGVCHVPEPGQTGEVWWFGFDCAHIMDLMPAMAAREVERGWASTGGTYRTVDYVRAEVESLAAQIAKGT